MELGQRLKQARLDAGLSQRQLCGDVITRNMLSQIENGSARPSMDTLQYLAARLGKPISFFLEETTASPNQNRIIAARSAYASGVFQQALTALENYEAPDPIFDAEFYLLRALCCIALAASGETSAQLLAQAAEDGRRTPYYTPDLERRRLLLLAQNGTESAASVVAAFPSADEELLLRAQAALEAQNPSRCAQLLDAAEDHSSCHWLILRADAAFACEDYHLALEYYQKAEPMAASQVYPKIEQCCLKLDDYKMAYHYACKQR